jgi:hypothetical protein
MFLFPGLSAYQNSFLGSIAVVIGGLFLELMPGYTRIFGLLQEVALPFI